jgi:serine/threonine protein kinase
MSTEELLCGRYALWGVLGRGGMADVRDGWDTRLGRGVAIKLLHPELTADADTLRRFEHEARIAAALSHPNIVAVHDQGHHAGTPFIVMERLPGHSLADLIARGPLPQPLVRNVIGDILAALAAAHRAGTLHRDIKPGNILFTASGTTKVADFGIAKTTDTSHTMIGQVVGTVAYLSPDRLMGTPATPSDDLYAVGVVGYEALTGRRAFPQDTLGALSQAIMTQRPPPLAALRPDVDPVLAALIERAMAPQAPWRFGSAEEMLAALPRPALDVVGSGHPATMILTSALPPASAVASHARPVRRSMSRTRRVVTIAAASAAVLIAATAFVVDSWVHPPPSPMPNEPAATTSIATTTSVSSSDDATTTATATPTGASPPPGRPRRHGHGHGDADNGD